ncbi:MAG: hypothetical protein AB1749_11265 [Pseudomonadota bacterium]
MLGLTSVVVCGVTLPATRLAAARLDAWAVAFGRALLAGLLAAALLGEAVGVAEIVRAVVVAATVLVGWRARIVRSSSTANCATECIAGASSV